MAAPFEAAFLAGRALLGGYFVWAGLVHFLSLKLMAEYAAAKKVPFPTLAIAGTGLLLALGGLSVVLGVQPLLGLSFLVMFLIGVTPVMHDFWRVADPARRMNERGNFLRNAALLGAVLSLMVLPEPWALSLALGA